MRVFVAFDGDTIGQMVGRAREADDVEQVRKVNQRIELGNEIWRAWATNSGGSIIEIGGDEGALEVPADKLDELPAIRAQYAEKVEATVSVGVGMKLSEASKALLAAKLSGKDRIVFYTEDCDKVIEEAQKHAKDEEGKIADEYLNKAQPAMNPHAFAGAKKPAGPTVQAPTQTQGDHSAAQDVYDVVGDENAPAPAETTHAAKDFEKQLHEEAWKGHEQDIQGDVQSKQNIEQIKGQVAQALLMLKQSAPMLEQIKPQNPQLYMAVMQLAQTVIAITRELVPQGIQKANSLWDGVSPLRKDQLQFPFKTPTLTQTSAEPKPVPEPQAASAEEEIHPDPRVKGAGQVVYRVQNAAGQGPYQHSPTRVYEAAIKQGYGRNEFEGHHGSLTVPPATGIGSDMQPGPFRDFGGETGIWSTHPDRQSLTFGFQSPAHAREWFGNEGLATMKQHGYELVPVRAKQVWPSKSGRQVVFLPHDEDMGKAEGDAWDEEKKTLREHVHNELAKALRAPKPSEREELVHYSTTPGLHQVDVGHMGSGAPAAEYRQGVPEVPRAYYYRANTKPEPIVVQGAKAVYRAQLDTKKQKLYDLGADPEGLRAPARERFLAGEGLNSPEDTLLDAVRAKGYYGYWNSASSMPHVVALFHPHPVHELKPAKKGEMKTEVEPEEKPPVANELEKGALPMPKAPTRHNVVLPVGSQVDDKVKVQHQDGKTSWKQMEAGAIRSMDPAGHPTSSRSPNSK